MSNRGVQPYLFAWKQSAVKFKKYICKSICINSVNILTQFTLLRLPESFFSPLAKALTFLHQSRPHCHPKWTACSGTRQTAARVKFECSASCRFWVTVGPSSEGGRCKMVMQSYSRHKKGPTPGKLFAVLQTVGTVGPSLEGMRCKMVMQSYSRHKKGLVPGKVCRVLQTVGTVDPSLEGIWCKTETSRQKLNLSAAWSLKEKS